MYTIPNRAGNLSASLQAPMVEMAEIDATFAELSGHCRMKLTMSSINCHNIAE